MTVLSEKVMSKITQDKITPIPKWQFLLKSKFIWAMAIVSVFLGAVAVAISLYLVTSPIDSLPTQSAYVQFWQFLATLPYFWLVLVAVSMYVAYHNFVHTEDGYRWKTVQVLGGAFLTSVVIGIILLYSGFAPWLNSYFVQHVPGYTVFGDMRGIKWMNPEQGRLAGQILSVDSLNSSIDLRDLNGKSWDIKYNALTFSGVELKKDEVIKVVGKQTGAATFSAIEFRPWQGQGMMRRMMQGNGGRTRITR